MKDWLKEHNLTLQLEHGYQDGVIVGIVKEFNVIAQSYKSEEELRYKINKGLEGYFIAFPEELEKLK